MTRHLAAVALVLFAGALSAQTVPPTHLESPREVRFSEAARQHMAAAVERDTVVAFCALDYSREGSVLAVYMVARAATALGPECGAHLPILARPKCFLHVRELRLTRFMMICEEGKFFVERAPAGSAT